VPKPTRPARPFKDLPERDRTLLSVARTASSYGNHSKAIEAAKQITDPEARNAALAHIAKTASSYGNAAKAIAAAELIDRADVKDTALAHIAKTASSYGSPKRAIEAARQIANAYTRDTALAQIAKIASSYGSPEMARQAAELMGAPSLSIPPSPATPPDQDSKSADRLADYPELADLLQHLGHLRTLYQEVSGTDWAQAAAGATAQMIQNVLDDLQELFRRLSAQSITAQTSSSGQSAARRPSPAALPPALTGPRRWAVDEVLRVEYCDQLTKLAELLGQDYLLDILNRPELWDDPQGRAQAVTDAMTEFGERIIRDIKQVNADQAPRFQWSLDSLARALKGDPPPAG
jgi:hypothetical protein